MSICYTDTPPTETSPLSLHDALPISSRSSSTPGSWTAPTSSPHSPWAPISRSSAGPTSMGSWPVGATARSEEHTSELQSRGHLVCRLLLEKKKHYNTYLQSTNNYPFR